VRFYRFTVEGVRNFPLDMLRHDHCWPASQDDVELIARTLERESRLPFRIRLATYRLATTDGPTVRRWESFGWRVVTVETQSTRVARLDAREEIQ
jgi:hypothetical protein